MIQRLVKIRQHGDRPPLGLMLVLGAQRFLQPRLPCLAIVEHARNGLLQTLWHLVADDPNAVFVLRETHTDIHARYTTALYHQWQHKRLTSRMFWEYRGLNDTWRSLRESNPCFSLERDAIKS